MHDAVWHVYLLECADGTLYCGVTSDLDRRLAQHNGLKPGGADIPGAADRCAWWQAGLARKRERLCAWNVR